MLAIVSQLRRKVEWHARRTMVLSVGIVLLAVGGGFLVAAAWMAMVPHLGALGASLAVGAGFVGAGLVALALRGTTPEPRIPTVDDELRRMPGAQAIFRSGGDFPPMLEAFLFGVSVYLQVRNRRR